MLNTAIGLRGFVHWSVWRYYWLDFGKEKFTGKRRKHKNSFENYTSFVTIEIMKKSTLISVAILILLYVLSYGWFRQTHLETWEKDDKDYVIFPTDKTFLYYFFRPLALIDGKLTGINFHIGQHR